MHVGCNSSNQNILSYEKNEKNLERNFFHKSASGNMERSQNPLLDSTWEATNCLYSKSSRSTEEAFFDKKQRVNLLSLEGKL